MQTFSKCTIDQLLEFDPQHIKIITANNRLAVFIKSQLLERQTAVSKVVTLPAIYPYQAFLGQLADSLSFRVEDMPLILNETAQQYYWQQAINAHQQSGDELLNTRASAAAASQAHRLQAEWGVDVRDDETNPEYETFSQWRKDYEAKCAALPAWDTPQLNQAILSHIQQETLKVPRYIVLLGFYSLNAYQLALLNAFTEQGVQILELDWKGEQTSDIKLYSAENKEQELQAALTWALEQITTYPERKLAIVMPELQANVAWLRRRLRKTFQHTYLENRWHIAVGRPLSEWGLIRSALAWFRLMVAFTQGRVELATIGQALLQAEFTLNSSQQDRLVQWDVELREANYTSLSLDGFAHTLAQIAPVLCSVLLERVSTWQKAKLSCGDWAQSYRDFLTQVGFPGETSLNSVNYQLCHAFEKALKEFALLDEMLPELNATDALNLFEQGLSQKTFQAQRHKDAVLDIVGLYETEGGQWDALWVTGLNDKVLPQAASPNPYLPIRSQKRAQVLHASPESEMQWAEQLFNAILHSAPQLILSWYEHDDDVVFRHSSFLQPYIDKNMSQVLPDQAHAVSEKLVLEAIDDSQGLPRTGVVKGGYGILEKQSRNPLWAYATTRLHLDALGEYPQTELNQFVRGNFLHKAMELFYTEIRTQAELADATRVNEILDKAVIAAADTELKNISSNTVKALSIARTQDILKKFIAVDLTCRQEFAIEQLEKGFDYSEQGLTFRFKVDRIDQVIDQEQNSAYVFIDYKSGKLGSVGSYEQKWRINPRLTDLQLPLYAAVLDIFPAEQVAGVAFTSLHRANQGYVGIWQSDQYDNGNQRNPVKSIGRDEWMGITAIWKGKITELIGEMAAGDARNRVYDVKDMMFCQIKPFLRLHTNLDDTNEGETND